jgi:hypothetical protein
MSRLQAQEAPLPEEEEEEHEPDINPNVPVPNAIDRIIQVIEGVTSSSRRTFEDRDVTLLEDSSAIDPSKDRARNACDAARDDIDDSARKAAERLRDGEDDALARFFAFKEAAVRRLRGLPDHRLNAQEFDSRLATARETCLEIAEVLRRAKASRSQQQKREILKALQQKLRRADAILREIEAIGAERLGDSQ